MTENWTVALAGSGEVTAANAIALLDDWLPPENVGLVFPKLPRNAKVMREIVKWAESEEIDVHQDITLDQIVPKLEELRNGGDQVYLVLAWDDTEASSKLLEQALAADIQVKDLTRALDDLQFEDEDAPDEPTAAHSSEGESEPKDNPVSNVVEPPKDTSVTAIVEPGDGQVAGTKASTPSADAAPDVVQASAIGPATVAPDGMTYARSDSLVEMAVSDQTPWIGLHLEGWIRAIVRDEYAILTAPVEKLKLVPALLDEDGNYRLGGKGRPRKGEVAVQLTPEEARAVGILIDEQED